MAPLIYFVDICEKIIIRRRSGNIATRIAITASVVLKQHFFFRYGWKVEYRNIDRYFFFRFKFIARNICSKFHFFEKKKQRVIIQS
jgi:hypothetical protein